MGTPSSAAGLDFDALYRDMLPLLERRLHSVQEAADVFQEAVIRWLGLPDRQSVREPRAYFYRVAINIAVDRMRARSLHAEQPGVDESIVDPMPLPDRHTGARMQLERLQQAVDALPPRCREVFLLFKVEGLGQEDIAARLGISRNMVEKHVIRALVSLRAAVPDILDF
ncbi:MAG TPA: sigma-70 family RNA polymerase sigma factor [Burkholderiales bacterium]|nr:sigma-70 family RNA polymerase sigma factor [Burkholderiales bacterium]